MIVPVIASPVTRSAAVRRVRRKDSPAEDVVAADEDPLQAADRGGERRRRERPRVRTGADDTPTSKSSAAVLMALGKLQLGG